MSVPEQEFRMNPGVPLDAILERVFYWPLVWFAVSASLRNGCHRFLPRERTNERVRDEGRERASERACADKDDRYLDPARLLKSGISVDLVPRFFPRFRYEIKIFDLVEWHI